MFYCFAPKLISKPSQFCSKLVLNLIKNELIGRDKIQKCHINQNVKKKSATATKLQQYGSFYAGTI